MNKKRHILIITISFVVSFMIVYHFISKNLYIKYNNKNLNQAILSIDSEIVSLNDIVPFEWDKVYTFKPYVDDKNSIQEKIGFKSEDIKENYINENMVHLLFVKDKKVVGNILSYPQDIGYNIKFKDIENPILYTENSKFIVKHKGNIMQLKQI